ncbi:AAA family ATPase [Azospirillum brasilense]|uniref:AAA family ATPase n=1 Tax=Azospirillum brasilense TaxID=192 RepID=UPI00190C2C6A|nr:AAA family ATPase [Azospirillum brasilense]MBK3734247.1 AAA family ATPase [Azospirillum brasilense]
MYVRSIRFENLGPISQLDITPPFNPDGSPTPLILVGQNGAGKSLTLATILDTIVECRKKAWTSIAEVKHDEFLRLMKKSYIRSPGNYSLASVKLEDGETQFELTEIATRISHENFSTAYASLIADHPDINSSGFPKSGFYKGSKSAGDVPDSITRSIYLYFPYFRYEPPAWINASSSVDFSSSVKFFGTETASIIKTNVVEEIQRWLLNTVLDRELYEKVMAPVEVSPGQKVSGFYGYNGSNSTNLILVNNLLTKMYQMRDSSIQSARVGIGPRANRQISVFVKRNDEDEVVASPAITQLSSGELMTLAMFSEIIREWDYVTGRPAANLNEIKGVVLIDEIDLHLHISFQKAVLPQIISMFPNVQFIVTSHSPFFLLGMAQKNNSSVQICNLPIGNIISPEEFIEFQAGYDVYFEKNQQFRLGYENLKRQAAASAKPLIITEGKTDWKHIKAALNYLNGYGQHTDIDVEFLEYSDDVDMGDDRLARMCEHFARVAQTRKMIFVFDRDNPTIIGKMSGSPGRYRSWGNQVFSLCIPEPPNRKGYKNISIEFYYSDGDLRTVDPSTNRRLIFSNEIEKVIRPGKNQVFHRLLQHPETSEEFEKKIYDQDCDKIIDEFGHQVAMSKAAFADLVAEKRQGFDSFDRTSFTDFFDIVRDISSLP